MTDGQRALQWPSFSRRLLMTGLVGLAGNVRIRMAAAQEPGLEVSLPIRWPDAVAGQGFWIRHGFACENTWYNPGWWHCGEDWYALDDAETAGAEVLAVRGGEVVFAGSEYPGRVVIVRQDDGLFAMYGHLEPETTVGEGEVVSAGQVVGTVLRRDDGRAPSHLHFELRDFLFNDRINGDNPEHGVSCGQNCAPGPGYWPMSAEHPATLGWLNPTHVLAESLWLGEATVAQGADRTLDVWSHPEPQGSAERVATMEAEPGTRLAFDAIWCGDPAAAGTSAEAYAVWGTGPELDGWVRIAVADFAESGADGRPSAVRFNFTPEGSSST